MPRPDGKKPILEPLSGTGRYTPRRVLRGGISDEFGKGICVFTRQEERGFTDQVEFSARENGIVATNFFAEPTPDDNAQSTPIEPLLEYRYSIIPEEGCAVEYLKILVETSELDMAELSLSLSWRGDGEAEICLIDAPDVEKKSPTKFLQNQPLDLADLNANKTGFYLKIPSHSLSLSLNCKGDFSVDQKASISIIADCIFQEKSSTWNSSPRGALYTGSGRIQPDKVHDIIEIAEQGSVSANAEEDNDADNNGSDNRTDSAVIGDAEAERRSAGSAYIDVIISQKIELYHGEDIILNTSALFDEKVGHDATFVSASLPEWIFLDQRNGDLMGTVPACKEDCLELAFAIYAVDFEGNSAKAIVPVECAAPRLPAGEDLHDYSFSEGSAVSIATVGMFVDFGLNVTNLEFTGSGLPEGLSVAKSDGLITGFLEKGAAANAPYNIIVTASEPDDAGGGISMQFLLEVAENEHLTSLLCNPASSEAIKNLYKMNRESEQILAAGIIGELNGTADGYAVQEMPLTGSNLEDENDFPVVPSVCMFAPERHIYLQIQNGENGDEVDYLYEVNLLDQNDNLDMIECAPDGFIKIKCMPDHRFVDFELVQKTNDGVENLFDICVDTFEGRMMPVHHQSNTFTEKQLRQLSAA